MDYLLRLNADFKGLIILYFPIKAVDLWRFSKSIAYQLVNVLELLLTGKSVDSVQQRLIFIFQMIFILLGRVEINKIGTYLKKLDLSFHRVR